MRNKDKYMLCPNCKEQIRKHSLMCKSCNSILDPNLQLHKDIQDGKSAFNFSETKNNKIKFNELRSDDDIEEIDLNIKDKNNVNKLACKICKSIEGDKPVCSAIVDQYTKDRKSYYKCISKDRTQIVLLYKLLQKFDK